jgi:arylsulfatase A-like enzyme
MVARIGLCLSLVLYVAFASGRVADGATAPANIILIIADDLAADDLGCYGHPSLKTPNIDRLAREGMRFTRAFVTTSSCSPSRCSMLTGKYPHSTGAERLHQPLPAEQSTFVEALGRQGYWTAAAGKWHLGEPAKQRFDLVLGASPIGQKPTDASGCGQWLAAFEQRPADKPFFLWLASFDPHRPYENLGEHAPGPDAVRLPPYLPDAPEVRRDMADYYGEIERLDRYVGGVLDALDRSELNKNTLVVLLSDNGRPFPREKVYLFDSGIRTPLLMRFPEHVHDSRRRGDLARSVAQLDAVVARSAQLGARLHRGRAKLARLRSPRSRDPRRAL